MPSIPVFIRDWGLIILSEYFKEEGYWLEQGWGDVIMGAAVQSIVIPEIES